MYERFRTPVLYLVRHGETELNDADKFRGWQDVPLNENGRESAQEVSYYLNFTPIGVVATSDLRRACETAEAISTVYDRNPNIRPWNIGPEFEGKPRSTHKPKLKKYIDDPSLSTPEGESLTEFKSRWETALNEYLVRAVAEAPAVVVTHTSNIIAAHQILCPHLEGQYILEHHDIVGPGGVIAVYLNEDGTADFEPVLGEVIAEDEGAPTS